MGATVKVQRCRPQARPHGHTAAPRARPELPVDREGGSRSRGNAASSACPLGESDPHSQALLQPHCNWIKPQEDSFILFSLNCVSAEAPY